MLEETWSDATGSLVRREERDSQGSLVRIVVRRGNNLRELDLSEEGAPHFKSVSYLDAENGWLATQAGGPVWWRDLFRGPTVETLGETEVKGRAAILVRVPPPESGENSRPIEATVDKDTGWPLEIGFFGRAEAGGFESVGKWLIEYQLVESLALDSVIQLFELEAPGGDARSYREMSLADAKAFQAFPLLYVGDSFDGMALDTITETGSSAPELYPFTQQVFFIYVEWTAEGPKRPARQLDIVIMPAATIAGASRESGEGQESIVTGRGPALFSAQENRLEIETEGVLIVIRGDNVASEQILKAAETLMTLNPGAVRPSSPTAAAAISPTAAPSPSPTP
jgi:hypothetical protein